MARYQSFRPDLTLRIVPDRKWINGQDPADPDYAAYQAWLAAGNVAESGDKAADPPAAQQLTDMDRDIARVGEDLIDLLISKGVIATSDFGPSVVAKLAKRKQLRAKLAAEQQP